MALPISMAEARRRVAKGARKLDSYFKDKYTRYGYLSDSVPWHHRIQVFELDMENGAKCMLGQMTGDYTSGVFEIFGTNRAGQRIAGSEKRASACGFVILRGECENDLDVEVESYRRLKVAWGEECFRRWKKEMDAEAPKPKKKKRRAARSRA